MQATTATGRQVKRSNAASITRGMRTVLCAVDLDEDGDEALRQAALVADNTGATLSVLHVVAIPTPAPVAEMPPLVISREELVATGQRELDRRLAVAGISPVVERQAVIAAEAIHAQIVAAARAMSADLLVIGSHQRSALSRVLLGSTAAQVVRHATCPVLVARPTAARGKVVAATDLSEASLGAVRAAADEALRRGDTLIVTHCLDLPPEGVGLGGAAVVPAPPELADSRKAARDEARARVTAWLAQQGVDEATVVIEEAPPERAIVALAEQLPAELVVVGTTGRSGLKRVLLGSVAETVVRKAPCSVMVVRATA